MHFLIGLVLGVIAGAVAHHFEYRTLIVLIAGAAVAVLYWLIVATLKGKLSAPDIDFDIPGFD